MATSAQKTQFEVGQSYGNDLTIEVLSRTAKTLTIKTTFGTQRIKVKDYTPNCEYIIFKCWLITAAEVFDADVSREILYEKAYLS